MMALAGKVAIVTGASRGVGKGIALQLGEAGATVYITGRTASKTQNASAPGSLEETAKEVAARGGKCIPVACDHSKDSDIDALFAQVNTEQNGQLDILVNNAFSAVNSIMGTQGRPFWKLPPTFWDEVNNVGLRNHYICSVKAAEMMTARKSGLIINVSSIGGIMYLFTPAYGIGKAAKDRMAADCAKELKKYNVTFISLWPGPVQTEIIQEKIMKPMKEKEAQGQRSASPDRSEQAPAAKMTKIVNQMFNNGETIEFSGRCIVALAQDKNIIKRTGQIITTADIGEEFDLTDVDGRRHYSTRSIKNALQTLGWTKTADYIPGFIKIPRFVMNVAYGRL
ncbi:dehydrogenase/reductase SDR family member 1-like [Paramacrobiotus metropolitanus]|uniref:dehydrogenase/reductase SDR family member 1-like n=1 Tax=Paramacrobiotus metropolitanus TaxID=2943436 RepID=UPI002445C17F|nr:dehydrogenase/reductase SDR family member 1-like [Paramacrobiotus metropolitanus]